MYDMEKAFVYGMFVEGDNFTDRVRYNLGSKSNISRIKTALQDKEMIDFDKDSIYLEDPVFKIWFKRHLM